MPDPVPTRAPFGSRRLMEWMATHDARLRGLLEVAEPDGGDPVEELDASMRAHLQFMAEGMQETARAELRDGLEGFAEGLQDWFDLQEDERAAHLERARAAIALEQHLRFGVTPGDDPSLDAAMERRARLGAWGRLFLIGLEDHLGVAADGASDAALAWIGAHQAELSRLTVSFDHRSRSALPPDADAETRDCVARTAGIRAYVRHVAEALEATLPGGAAADGA